MVLVVAALGVPTALAQQRQNPMQTQQATRAEPGAPVREEVAGPAEEKTSQTSHTIRLGGKDIKYTATAGTLPIRSEDGKVAARMFFVAYTKDGEDVRTRPISFLYNGGPAPRRSGCTGGPSRRSTCRCLTTAFSLRRRTG